MRRSNQKTRTSLPLMDRPSAPTLSHGRCYTAGAAVASAAGQRGDMLPWPLLDDREGNAELSPIDREAALPSSTVASRLPIAAAKSLIRYGLRNIVMPLDEASANSAASA